MNQIFINTYCETKTSQVVFVLHNIFFLFVLNYFLEPNKQSIFLFKIEYLYEPRTFYCNIVLPVIFKVQISLSSLGLIGKEFKSDMLRKCPSQVVLNKRRI